MLSQTGFLPEHQFATPPAARLLIRESASWKKKLAEFQQSAKVSHNNPKTPNS